ncbi:MAG: GNAT family N-acetyltransferase [Bacteroidetes bacterium]|nr:MAG: GNAT family N-acetyltransferase [Bacteroidota bacterium]
MSRTAADIQVRAPRPAELPTLVAVGRESFLATFGEHYETPEFDRYVAETYSLKAFQTLHADPTRSLYLAEVEGEITGYAALKRGAVPPQLAPARLMGLDRLYVLPPWHGRGVGAALMDHCVETARAEGWQGMWLGVWQHNDRAMAFYRKYGFAIKGTHPFQLGDLVEDDYVMYWHF